MMLRIKQRGFTPLTAGFTLIELLVVIAIIGILASVVLASLNNARDKGEDAQTRQQLSSLRAEAEISYDDNSRVYSNVCEDTELLYRDLNVAASVNCDDGVEGYMVEVQLNNDSNGGTQWFCVDSQGSATTSPGSVVNADELNANNSPTSPDPDGTFDIVGTSAADTDYCPF